MTLALQLLVFVGAIAALIAFGFYRDKREHAALRNPEQSEIYFPEHSADHDADEDRRGAAMSRLREGSVRFGFKDVD